jgi:transposase
MNATTTNYRQERGLTLAKGRGSKFRRITDSTYLVPSATDTRGAGYVVDLAAGTCSCPDYETRGGVCKHQWAMKYVRQEIAMPNGTTVVTEKIRISYPQNWAAYNKAQCEEERTAKVLLRSLCDGITEPAQKMGRPRIPLSDATFAAAMKVYGTMSGRRSTTDLKACEAAGLIERAPAYNTVFRRMEDQALAPLFKRLVDESARPLAAVESQFAADGTGFATQTYVRWFDFKHGEDRRVQQWVKLHAMVGTATNVITAAEVTTGTVHDSPQFVGLVERTAASGFRLAEVSADKAYLSHDNLATVEKHGGQPYIPFKSNSLAMGSAAWERLYHLFSLNREDFLRHYHKRSNVESTFSAMKRKFGAGVRSKTEAAQYNEVLLKCLCHNLSMLVHSIHELGVEPKFWLPREVQS